MAFPGLRARACREAFESGGERASVGTRTLIPRGQRCHGSSNFTVNVTPQPTPLPNPSTFIEA
jgi:hypothetical protein